MVTGLAWPDPIPRETNWSHGVTGRGGRYQAAAEAIRYDTEY